MKYVKVNTGFQVSAEVEVHLSPELEKLIDSLNPETVIKFTTVDGVEKAYPIENLVFLENGDGTTTICFDSQAMQNEAKSL